jgi:glycerophosphoryl diester phosphodiesterase
MFFSRTAFCLVVFLLVGCEGTAAASEKPIVIAHRGASGYLPEHTIAAKAMAYAQGADYIEQDLVMTKDDRLVVLHDRYLDSVTNVDEVFPDRNRGDGRYYVIDFTIEEIRRLSVSQRFGKTDESQTPVFEDRFPLGKSSFRVHTFEEEIELIQGLNASTGKSIGIYPEIKYSSFHHGEGKDIGKATLTVLKEYGYTDQSDKIFLQCNDAVELRRIHGELMPEMEMEVPLVQLIGSGKKFHWMQNKSGMLQVSAYADGIGTSIRLLMRPESTASNIMSTGLVELAHEAGMLVHAYTFRRERNQMPPFAKDYADFLRMFIDDIGVDGVFTDFPDLTVEFVESTR